MQEHEQRTGQPAQQIRFISSSKVFIPIEEPGEEKREQ
jgi:hypothetical protein